MGSLLWVSSGKSSGLNSSFSRKGEETTALVWQGLGTGAFLRGFSGHQEGPYLSPFSQVSPGVPAGPRRGQELVMSFLYTNSDTEEREIREPIPFTIASTYDFFKFTSLGK